MTDPLSLLPDPVRWLVMAYALPDWAVFAALWASIAFVAVLVFLLLETLVSHFSAEAAVLHSDRPGEAGAVEADPHSLRPRLNLGGREANVGHAQDWYPLEEEA